MQTEGKPHGWAFFASKSRVTRERAQANLEAALNRQLQQQDEGGPSSTGDLSRMCFPVLPGVFLGSKEAECTSSEALAQMGITHVLQVRGAIEIHYCELKGLCLIDRFCKPSKGLRTVIRHCYWAEGELLSFIKPGCHVSIAPPLLPVCL